MNKFLITGGAGYIGSHLAQNLANSGYPVRVLDNFSGASRELLEAMLSPYAERVEIVEGDVLDGGVCRKAMADISHVLHFASLNNQADSLEMPAQYLETNTGGTAVLLNAVKDSGNIQRVVLASSCAVYGESPAMSKNENSLTDPITPYACSKLAAETLCWSSYKLYDLPVLALRFFNPYGPEENARPAQGALSRFLQATAKGQTCILNGNGEQTRDFVYLDDCLDACIAACNAPRMACGHVFNVGTGMRVSLNEAIESIQDLLGRSLAVERRPLPPGDIRHSRADVTKAAGMLQFTASVPFEVGLARMFEPCQTFMAKAA